MSINFDEILATRNTELAKWTQAIDAELEFSNCALMLQEFFPHFREL